MSEEKLLSRAELAALAGVPDDAVVFWIRQGLLESVVTEDRKHKRFTLREARMARLLGELRNYGMNVAAMREVVEQLRAALALYDEIPPSADLWEAIDHAEGVAGPPPDWPADLEWDHDRLSLLPKHGHFSADEIEGMRRAAAAIPAERAEELRLADQFEKIGGAVMLWRDETGSLRIRGGEPQGSPNLQAASLLVFDFSLMFEGIEQ